MRKLIKPKDFISETMKHLACLILLVLVCGCLSGETAQKPSCDDVGCPVETTLARTTGPNCGDGILEGAEQCDLNAPCKSGYCQKCRCVEAGANETVSDCNSACLKHGFDNYEVVDDGQCNHPRGVAQECSIMCSYRKIMPMNESGKVCCCRNIGYAKCGNDSAGKCACPGGDEEVKRMCREKNPEYLIAQSGG